ncbi:kinase-like domain-containing protein [Aspergillus coremiiformis]|uniref:Kinase-like domain-containing protein n=1 Tax=Aspergillus coremiiformis TaxID=138285 RepID=A0A5N6Z8Q8_9EURO|nr:kinase-like domain-containing protein [Aspergillus coremiiformis]
MWLICSQKPPDHQIEQPTRQNIIAVGQLAIVHKLSDRIVRKVPTAKSDASTRAIHIEAQVYRHLGKHTRIARCLRCGDDYIDVQYEPHGDLETYLRKNWVTDRFRHRVARQAIEAVVFIHSKGVIHSDLAARQFLVDPGYNVRLSDFGGSSLLGEDALVMENATHFLPRDEDAPNTVWSDLFALGSTVYEILLGMKPYEGIEDEEIQRLYSSNVFPSLDKISDGSWRKIIRKCWMSQYNTTAEILKDVPLPPLTTRLAMSVAQKRLARGL